MNGQGRTRINVWAIIGAIVCAGVIIIGIVIYNDTVSVYPFTDTFRVGKDISFGADFYTEIYDVTKDAGNSIVGAIKEAAESSESTARAANHLIEATGWLMICFGAVMGVFFASKIVEKAPQPSPELEAILARFDSGITVRTMTEKAEEDENHRKERERLNEHYYQIACEKKNYAETKFDFTLAAESFEAIKDYKDSAILASECRKKANSFVNQRTTQPKRSEILSRPLYSKPMPAVSFLTMQNTPCNICGKFDIPLATFTLYDGFDAKDLNVCESCYAADSFQKMLLDSNETKIGDCDFCGKMKVPTILAEYRTSIGLEYRHACKECFIKNGLKKA